MVEGEKKKKKKAAQQYPPFWLHEQSLFTVLYTYILCVSVCTILYIYIYIEYLSLSPSLFRSKRDAVDLWSWSENRRPKNFSLSQKIARNPSTHQSTQPQWVSGCTSAVSWSSLLVHGCAWYISYVADQHTLCRGGPSCWRTTPSYW